MKLIPYRKKDKWGFCNSANEIEIECKYDNVVVPHSDLNFGLSLVEIDKKTCWINADGNEMTLKADQTHLFTEYEISVIILNKSIETVSKFPNCYFVNSKGKTLFDNDYLTASHFQNGFCIVMDKDRTYGAIDSEGKLVIPFETKDYNIIWEKIGRPIMSDARQLNKTTNKLFLFSTETRYMGFKNEKDEIILSAKYIKANEFSDGFALVAEKLKDFFFIDSLGNRLNDKTYFYGGAFSNGIAKVVTNKIDGEPTVHSRWGVDYWIPDSAKWGYIDSKGTEYWED
jgi:hypothetical protein